MNDAGQLTCLDWRRFASWAPVCALVLLTARMAPAATNAVMTYSVHTWQTEEGLPQSSVRSIAQTQDGYLWIGTHEGLARFDGVRFTPLEDSSAPELQRGSIGALCAGRDGSLWIGCDGYGVARWREGKLTHFSEADGLVSNQIRDLLEDRDGSLWIASEGGLTRYKDGRFRNFTEKDNLPSNSVRGVCQDQRGYLLIATLRGLCTLDREGTVHSLDLQQNSMATALKFVCQGRQGRIWTGSNDRLICLDGDRMVSYGVREGLPDRVTMEAHEDRRGQLWVGTHHGVARMAQGKFIPPPSHEGVFGDLIYTIFEDREGDIWVGGEDGLYRLTPARFTAYSTPQGLTHNNAMSICEDQSGAICIGTCGGGVNRLVNGRLSYYGPGQMLRNSEVLSLLEGRDGTLWVGLEHGGGLYKIKDGAQSVFARQPDVFGTAIRVLHEDQEGTLWIGTSLGMNVCKQGQFASYRTADGLAGNMIMAMCEEAGGRLWIGTDAGLSFWEGGKFGKVKMPGGPPTTWVNALYLDRDQSLWVGTRGGGLHHYKDGKFATYTTKQGLFSDEIYEIVEDDHGYFWMTCRKGIFRVNKNHLEKFDPQSKSPIPCTSFGRADGLPSIQFNGVAKPAGWKSKDGRLWFPTIQGIVVVDPAIGINERTPPVYVEEVIADGRSLQSDPLAASAALSLKVPPGRGGIEIHYTALSLQASEKNRFKYRMSSVDPEWIDGASRRSVVYENIAPGRYHFQVIACNNDGAWNEEGATLALEFMPHYWQTWWFKMVLAALAVAVVGQLYQARVRRLHEIEQLRIQIAANLHDDVGARLTKMGMLSELVDRETTDSHPNKPHIRNIFRTVRDITQAMDEIVWTINPKNDTLENLANYIFQYAQEYFEDTGVSCRLDVPAQLPDRPVSTEARHNLFMAVKEALNNALKHSGATEVRVGLAATDGHMIITIADNGHGFSVGAARGKGNGLDNMTHRLEQIGGHLVLESEPGRGTSIRMEAGGA
jgi:ligand-binding sensor domain-containing protein/signal transduction histidine kinase